MKKYRNPYIKSVKSLSTLEKQVNSTFKQKHKTNQDTYNVKIITDIIFNEKSRMVALFKDHLILDDSSEFLRRFYNKVESRTRLTKILNFYESYSKIFPNYIIIPESKYLYKNIRRKQKMIDACNQIKIEEEENRKNCGLNNIIKKKKADKFFDTEIRQSILRYKPSFYNCNSVNKSTQSVEKIHNISVSISLNLNRNIYEGEESFVSVQNILNVMDKKVENEDKREENKQIINKLKSVIEDKSKVQSNFVKVKPKLRSNQKLEVVILDKGEKKVENITNTRIDQTGKAVEETEKLHEKQHSKDNPLAKKLCLRKLTLNNKEMTSPLSKVVNSNANTIIHTITSENKTEASSLIVSPKRMITHRVSSSIPDSIYKTAFETNSSKIKILNNGNSPNIIIPSGNTVNINNNFYNYGTYQPQIITIEHFDTEKVNKFQIGNNGIINPMIQTNSTPNPIEHKSFSPSERLQRFKTINGEHKNNKVYNVVNSLKNQKEKTNSATDTQTILESARNTNTTTNKRTQLEPQQVYSKVIKIFQDNLKFTNNKLGSFKSISKNKITRNSKGLRGEKLENDEYFSNFTEMKQETEEGMSTEREGKTRMEMKEAYKKFLEQNKLESLTARNSLEKVSSTYKILNGDLTNTLAIASGKTGSVFQSRAPSNNSKFTATQKNFSYKKNIYLSPNPIELPLSSRKSQDVNNLYFNTNPTNTIITPSKKPTNKILTPTRYSTKAKILKTETTEKQSTYNKTTTKKENQNLKLHFSPNLLTSSVSPNINSNLNTTNSKKLLSQQYSALRRVVKSLDFQSFKKK